MSEKSPQPQTIPVSETVPQFNPTNAAENQIYATGVRLDAAKDMGMKPYSDFEPDKEGVDIYRLEQRERVAEGVGLVASRVLLDGTIGDVGQFKMINHMVSSHKKRTASAEKSTPFVSFTTDPESLVKGLILKHGFGLKDGSDSVIVRAKVHPSRILSPGGGKKPEVLLTGGLSPDEYVSTHELEDFVKAHASEDDVVDTSRVGVVTRDEAIAKWRQVAADAHNQAA